MAEPRCLTRATVERLHLNALWMSDQDASVPNIRAIPSFRAASSRRPL